MVTYALRSLRRDPVLVAGILLTFALAIGANAAMFGLVSRLMLPAPPGVTDPTRVVRLTLNLRSQDGQRFATTTSYPAFQSVRLRAAGFSAVAAVGPTTTMVMGRGEEGREVRAIAGSGDYFAVLGAHPSLGRFFTAAEDELPSGEPVVVLSHTFWKSRFAAERDVIGRRVVLDGRQFTIIGVAARGFTGDETKPVDIFVPLSASMVNASPDWWNEPRVNMVSVIARLGTDVSRRVAAGSATTAARSTIDEITSVTFESLVTSSMRSSTQARIAKWLFGVTLVVLLIAIANVGVLLLLRALHRRRDLAVRIALGASRGRLAAQLVIESTLLAIGGGLTGLLVSRWFSEIARVTLLPDLARSERFVDGRVLVVTTVLIVVAGLLAGVAPSFLVAHQRLTAELHEWSTFGSPSRSRTQRLLVGVQVALCTVLLVGAGLFVRSLDRVQSQDLGFSTANLLYVTLDFRDQLAGPRRDEAYADAVRRVSAVRGVTAATVVQAMPFGHFHVPPISVPGRAEPPAAGEQLPMMYGTTPEYLRLMGVRLLEGRLLTEQDRRRSQLVVLVNETMAREVWPGESALGKCIRIGFDPNLGPSPVAPATLPCREIVGVVRDSRVRSLRREGREASLMQYYVPFGQLPEMPFGGDAPQVNGMLVGVQGSAAHMMPIVQRAIQRTSTAPLYARVQHYQDLLDPQLRPWRLGATLFVAFGALALGIAAVGLFGVVSYLVSQRMREIGLRLALGGTGARVGRWVIGGALRMVVVGCAAGVVAAAMVAPLVRELLFETSPFDSIVQVTAIGILLLVTVVAAFVPAVRAARVSPMSAMRIMTIVALLITPRMSSAQSIGSQVRALLPTGTATVEVLDLWAPPRLAELRARLQRAAQADPAWWQEHVRNAPPGQPLPYDRRFGISEAEYRELLQLTDSVQMRPTRQETLAIEPIAAGWRFGSGTTLLTLRGLEIDTLKNQVHSTFGDLPAGQPIVPSAAQRATGRWGGPRWELEALDSLTRAGTLASFAVGKLEATGHTVIYFNAQRVAGGRLTARESLFLRVVR